jgi:hypothetical protein
MKKEIALVEVVSTQEMTTVGGGASLGNFSYGGSTARGATGVNGRGWTTGPGMYGPSSAGNNNSLGIVGGTSTGGGGGSSRVICTHFYRKGEMSRELWAADMKYTLENLSDTTIRGYHYWAISYVKLMRKSPLAEKLIRPLAIARAEEIAFQAGARTKGNWLGKLVRLFGEPLCFTIGCAVGQKDWQVLYGTTQNQIAGISSP